jgi:hypothetical protein
MITNACKWRRLVPAKRQSWLRIAQFGRKYVMFSADRPNVSLFLKYQQVTKNLPAMVHPMGEMRRIY